MVRSDASCLRRHHGSETRHLLPGQRRTAQAHPSRHDPALPRRHRRTARGHGRPPHHRDADRGRLRDRSRSCSLLHRRTSSRFSAAAFRRAPIFARWRHSRFQRSTRLEPHSRKRREASPPKPEQFTASTVEEAVAEADVVLTLTSSVEPILYGKWLKPRRTRLRGGRGHPRPPRARRRSDARLRGRRVARGGRRKSRETSSTPERRSPPRSASCSTVRPSDRGAFVRSSSNRLASRSKTSPPRNLFTSEWPPSRTQLHPLRA